MPRYGGKYGQGYVVMFGMHGYMPDHSYWVPNKKTAIDAAIDDVENAIEGAYQGIDLPYADFTEKDLEAAEREAKRDIRKFMYAELDPKIFGGWEYCEIADAEEAETEE